MTRITFYIGLVLITISFIGCVLSYYLLVFGIPTFIFGAILVLISKQPIQSKLLTTLIPIVLYFPLTFLFLYFYNYSTAITILIPENFEGKLRIIYDENCGSNLEIIDGEKTLIFPENGILVLNEEFNRQINYNYYLVDDQGNKNEILEILEFKDRIKKRPSVLAGGSGTMYQEIDDKPTDKINRITFSDFYIYNKDSLDRSDYKSQQKFDSLTRIIVKQCRQQ